MDSGQAIDLVREALMLTLVLSAPVLAAALGIALVVSVLQAVTQVREQTLSFVPKILVTLAAMAAAAPWMIARLVEFSRRMFAALP